MMLLELVIINVVPWKLGVLLQGVKIQEMRLKVPGALAQ